VVTEERAIATMRSALVPFVKEHVYRFPGVLKSVSVVASGCLFSGFLSDCVWYHEEVQLEINRMLPPMSPPPLVLATRDALLHALAHPYQTDFSHLLELDGTTLRLGRKDLAAFRQHRDLLQICRNLRKVTTHTLGDGSLRWAMEEKRCWDDWLAIGSDENSS